MPSVFDPSDAPCGVFGAQVGMDDYRSIDFTRGVRTQNSAGEIITIYQPVATLVGELQPKPAGLTRELHGQVFMVKWTFIVIGTVALQDGDRAYVDGQQVEATQISRWGTQHAEIELGYIGR